MVQVSQKDKMTPNLIADLWECKCKCKCKYSVVSLFCFKCLFFENVDRTSFPDILVLSSFNK